jgi:hypothetical protein
VAYPNAGMIFSVAVGPSQGPSGDASVAIEPPGFLKPRLKSTSRDLPETKGRETRRKSARTRCI